MPALSLGSAGIRASGGAQASALSQDTVWHVVAARPAGAARRATLTREQTFARFSKNAFDIVTTVGPRDGRGAFVITLPLPGGGFGRFRASRSAVLAPAVAREFREIETYRAQGIDDPTATARFGWTPLGFHAIVLSASGTSYIDPYQAGDNEYHVVFSKQDHWHQGDPMRCLVGMGMDAAESVAQQRSNDQFPISHGTSLRTYRLALAATAEYTAAAGSVGNAMARMVATINRVNGVYERDLSVHLQLVTGAELIFTNASTDPYTNSSGSTMLTQNQSTLDSIMGSAAYDIGHVFSTGGGGIATLRSVCASGSKARGVTGLSDPTGDVFDIDYVAHEIGHQFGGSHTFNAGSSHCAGSNYSGTHAYEVGSGSTIQSYSGICSPENLQTNSDDYFHVESLDEMTAFLTTGGGSSCGSNTGVGNMPPTVSTPASFTIPRQTPFVLTADASDANGDSLTYAWEQFDRGAQTTSAASAGSDRGEGPLFRSRPPSSRPIREFPSMQYVLQHGNAPPLTYACGFQTCLTGEAVPNSDRTMQFQVTVRDNRAGSGGIATAMTAVTVTTAAGPFLVTSPNGPTTVTGGSTLTVTWNPNGTQLSPVNASQVEISLSTDGGSTFSTVLAGSTANDGSADVTVPNIGTALARIRIAGVGNIFFDVSDANFSIVEGTAMTPISCVGNAPAAGWVCVNGGWLPPDHPLASGSPTPTPAPTPTPSPSPTPSTCVGNAPVSNWVCVNGGWVPPDHPLAVGGPTPTPTPTPSPTPPPPPVTCVGNPPVAGWVCINGGWVPPNHPLAGGGGSP